MKIRKPVSFARRFTIPALLTAMGLVALCLPAGRDGWADQIHRNGFEGRNNSWLRGEDNVRAEEKLHALTNDYAHQGTSSEHIQIVCPDGKNDPNYVRYYYSTQPAPLTEEMTASVWVKANKSNIQLQARLVLPHERDLKQIDELMTVTLTGDRYQLARRWQRLDINNPMKLAKEQQQILRAQLKRDIDFSDAYIDRLTLNLYTGPGQLDVYIDDLEIGPVRTVKPPAPANSKTVGGTPTGKGDAILPPPALIRNERGILVKMEKDRLFVGGKPFFFRAIRHTDTPLKTLRDAGFNTVWFDLNTPAETIEEAVAVHDFWIIPSLPLLNGNNKGALTSGGAKGLAAARDTEEMGKAIAKFLSGDAVLFWDLGGALQTEKVAQVEQLAKVVRQVDPARPRGIDVWDGFGSYEPENIELIGTHRFPLMTTLELLSYRNWLKQRRLLTLNQTLQWTWIQTHLPEWESRLLYDQDSKAGYKESVGPQPEQIRLLTYLAIASGCRGLGYWSDRFLEDSHQGRDRWLMMALLNQEIHMLEPLLMRLREMPTWVDTSDGNVKAAVLRTDLGIVVLPIWLGGGSQYVPPQGSVANLKMVIDMVPEGSEPWEISPARVQSLQNGCKRVLKGTQIVIPEFDLTTAIVFTNDLRPDGLVARWQDRSRKMARIAAQWAGDLAAIELEKFRKVHEQLVKVAPPIAQADQELRRCEQYLLSSRRKEEVGDDTGAYLDAFRAMRPLRILMRVHWEQAINTLDIPSASPYAVSFYTLPRHWALARKLTGTSAGANALSTGDFDSVLPRKADIVQTSANSAESALEKLEGKVTDLPGWTVLQKSLDELTLEAKLYPAAKCKDEPLKKPEKKKFDPWAPSTKRDAEKPEPPAPKLGERVLRLEIKPKIIMDIKNKPKPAPEALERTYLAVNTPAMQFPPGSWVRISGWVRIPWGISATSDGAMMFDNVGGEALGVRLTAAGRWKQYHLYRKVPATGTIWVTLALTGLGVVQFDDIRVEALNQAERQE